MKLSPARNTINYLRKCRAAKDAGYAVSYTTDPDWLIDQAINRRAGWPEDPSLSRGSCRPVNGLYPRKAKGDYQNDFYRASRAVNTPRLIVRPQLLGYARKLLVSRILDRLYTED